MPTKPPVEHLELGLFGHARQLVTVQEVALKFVVNPQQVRLWTDEGWLLKVGIGSDLNKKEGDAEKMEREHYRIHRFSAEALMIFRTERDNGICPPYNISAEAAWWLTEIRKFNDLGKKLKG